ncbi:MAG TPA: CHASE2 domain-containing protein [Longimicrobiaceae bacterium]|nr:CHASE2 domain-containing protein [Longimicrobiaceae bacterium]
MLFSIVFTALYSFLWDRDDLPGDTALSLRALISAPSQARVKVVRIDDKDYDSLFGARSPLDPSVVTNLIHAIAASRPAVIGVDVESADPAYARIPDSVDGVPIVWERTPRCRGPGRQTFACYPRERTLEPAAGRREPGGERAGLVLLPEEGDGSNRRYARAEETQSGIYPSFTTVLLQRAGRPVETEPAGSYRLIRYRNTTREDTAYTARWMLRTAADGIDPHNGFRDRIVLLGGSFWLGRDQHRTPLGELPGVDVLAQILETELDGGGPRAPGFWSLFLVQVAAGLLIVAAFGPPERNWKPGLAAAFTLCLFVAPVASLVVFRIWKLWYYFLPALGIWLAQQLYERQKRALETWLSSRGAAPALAGSDGSVQPGEGGATQVEATAAAKPRPSGTSAKKPNRRKGRKR